MQRKTVAQPETGSELDSVVLSSEDSIAASSSKASKKSISTEVADRARHDATVTSSKFFPIMILLMEFSFSFVEASSEMYSIYALGGFTSTLGQIEAIDLMIRYRYIGTIIVLPVGIACDSYIGTYYPLIFFLCLLTGFTGLHAVISLPLVLFTTDTKLLMARITFVIFGLFSIVEPLRLILISRAILESDYFRQPRRFYAFLANALNLGIGAAGTIVYVSLNSRYALCTTMFANFGLMFMYTVFYMVSKRYFISDNSTKQTENIGAVEKAFAAVICQAFKSFDRHILRKLIFKGARTDGDYRCFTLSHNTQHNARALVGIAFVTLPLVAALAMLVIIDILYYVQLSMFHYYPADPYPLLSMKGYIFLLLFPLVECWIFPALRKCSRSEASRQLTMVGTGAMFVSMAMLWSLVVHKVCRDGNEFWYKFQTGTGHVAVTNCLDEPLDVRSQFIGYITHEKDGWTQLPPFKTINILNIPGKHSPFHFELSSPKSSMYDEYYLPIRAGQGSWYVILPTGVFPVPPSCFRRNSRRIVLMPALYGLSKVCVVCALTFCNGYVRFEGYTDENVPFSTQVALVPLTGRGTNDSIEIDEIATSLVGRYNITSRLGGTVYTSTRITRSFSHADTYMVVVYENLNKTDYVNGESMAHSIDPMDHSDLIKTVSMKTSPVTSYIVAWMYPTVFFHALTDVIYLVSLWMFLFTQSPDQIRTTVFCFVKLLSVPTYIYLHKTGAMILRLLKPMSFFYLALVNIFFMMVYFFCILFFIHKLFKGNQARRSSVNLAAHKLSSRATKPESSDEQKGK